MRLSAFAKMHVVQKEEKESRLKEFIARDLEARRLLGGAAEGTVYRLVALSAESPVAIALAHYAAEAAELGIRIEAVFLRRASAKVDGKGIAKGDCRFLVDQRFLDAHEQLILGDKAAWVGDCMRRDPAKRDAFESYSEGCASSARLATRAFLRITKRTVSGQGSTFAANPVGMEGPGVIAASLVASIEDGQVTFAFRH